MILRSKTNISGKGNITSYDCTNSQQSQLPKKLFHKFTTDWDSSELLEWLLTGKYTEYAERCRDGTNYLAKNSMHPNRHLGRR